MIVIFKNYFFSSHHETVNAFVQWAQLSAVSSQLTDIVNVSNVCLDIDDSWMKPCAKKK
jgi:hypothetical protein